MKGYKLRIQLVDLPLVWRQVLVPEGITFARLHRVIQIAMGWQDYHLYEFGFDNSPLVFTNDRESVEEHNYYKANPPEEDKGGFVARILSRPTKGSGSAPIDEFLVEHAGMNYVYDFGDHWQHRITLEGVVEEEGPFYPTLLAGEGSCPPEDVGGVGGFMCFLEAWHNPVNPENEDMVTWGRSMGYADAFSVEDTGRKLYQQTGPDVSQRDVGRFCIGVPFEPDSPFQLQEEISDDLVANISRLRYYRGFLQAIVDQGPLRATAKGNLPRQFVRERFAAVYDGTHRPESWRKPHEIYSEEDAWLVHELHILAKVQEHVRQHKGKISLTETGEAALQGSLGDLYRSLLQAYVCGINWEYIFDCGRLLQKVLGAFVWLIRLYGDEEREIRFYCDTVVSAVPHLLQGFHGVDQVSGDLLTPYVSRIVIQAFFAEYGLVTHRRAAPDASDASAQVELIAKTSLFDQVIVYRD